MKRLYVEDHVLQQLKREAQKDGRTIQKVAEIKLTKPFVMFSEYFKDGPTTKNIVTASSEAIQELEDDDLGGYLADEARSMAKQAPSEQDARDNTPPLGRLRSEIQRDIDKARTEWTEALEYCQDEEERTNINKERAVQVADLEQELAEVVF